MPTELNTNKNANDLTKKLWEKHQANEYTHVNNYKEAVCLGCLKVDVAAATIADICDDCASKRGREPLLVVITTKMYGLCFFCGHYKFGIEQVNGRFCLTCMKRIAKVTREYNKKGGFMNADPYWVHMKRKLGRDWRILMNQPKDNKR